MKTNVAQLVLVVAALGFAASGTSYAHEDNSEAGTNHWLRHLDSKSQPTANQLAPYGYATPNAAARVVNVDSSTKYLNVTRLEVIQVNAGGKRVTWKFDTLGTASFPLAKVIPGTEGVTVYVTENPDHIGG